jgi:hypothetical protein
MLDPLRLVAPPHPLGRRIEPRNKQKVGNGEPLRSRDVKNDDRPDYIYENKGNHDKMSTAIAEILHKFMHMLQKIARWQGQFAGELRFRELQAVRLQSICTVIGGLGGRVETSSSLSRSA